MADREKLPYEIELEILNYLSCKEIISRLQKWIPKLSLSQLQILTNNINSDEFESLQVVERITEDEAQYVPIQYYNFKPKPLDKLRQAQQDEANKFYTKCRFVDLQGRYRGEGMKAKWYNAIRTRRQDDAFRHFTDVAHIGDRAFRRNQLQAVTIPEGVVTIGAYAFYENELEAVTIPDSVDTIGNGAFQDNLLTSVTIPKGVETIEEDAFRRNLLTSVTIPEGVVTIGAAAFRRNRLTSVTIPEGVETIGRGAFRNNRLRSVTIREGVRSIGVAAFAENLLTSVTIPEGVVTIGEGAFDDDVEIVCRGDTDSGLGKRKRKRELLHKELQRIAIKF